MGDAAGDGLVIIKVEREFQLFDGDFLDVSSEAGFEVDVIEVGLDLRDCKEEEVLG